MNYPIKKTLRNRTLALAFADAVFITLAFVLAFLLRFDGVVPAQYLDGILQEMVIISLVFCLPIFYSYGLYAFSWSYVSTQELVSLFKATAISFFLTGFSLLIFWEWNIISSFPRSSVIIAYVLVFIFSGLLRMSKRIFMQIFKGKKGRVRTIIVGAGDEGEQILRGINNSAESHYLPIGIVDDNPLKRGVIIHGYPVLGKIEDIPALVEENLIECLIIAISDSGNDSIKRAVEMGRKSGLKEIKIIPSIAEIMNGEFSLGNLREVSIEDLLGREPVSIDTKLIENFIRNKVVLITGAAGSIGSELSRQIARFNPSLLVLLDQDETGIFNISKEIGFKFSGVRIRPIVADIRESHKIERLFGFLKPDIVFHAAAYKHVPLMEEHFDEAIKNNVLGTEAVVSAALKSGAGKFIFISTDKAVNPTSIMGATKRVGEMICQASNQKENTKFISVRFGNVLGSRGSVIPIFSEKIKRREAIEVTHPDMERYFMMIPEACLLVMQAAEMGTGGEVFVLDMGKPVKIWDLAKEMIKLSGLEPDKDIAIVFSGKRPGEKLFEEILNAEEGTINTSNKKIFIARLSKVDENMLYQNISRLKELAENNSKKGEITLILKQLIPTYNYAEENSQALL